VQFAGIIDAIHSDGLMKVIRDQQNAGKPMFGMI
jgi:hypothetical protein